MVRKQVITMPNAPNLPFSPAIKAGQYLFVSGQVGFKDPNTGEEIKGIKAQAKQCLEKIKQILEIAGSSLADVVKVTVILKNDAAFAEMNEVFHGYFPEDPPARTTIVASLVQPSILVEMDCIAYCS